MFIPYCVYFFFPLSMFPFYVCRRAKVNKIFFFPTFKSESELFFAFAQTIDDFFLRSEEEKIVYENDKKGLLPSVLSADLQTVYDRKKTVIYPGCDYSHQPCLTHR